MTEKSRKMDVECSEKCDTAYWECVSSREHESVCRMKRVQCDCGCSLE